MMKRTLILVTITLLAIVAPAQAEDLFFDSDGVKIRYTDQGEGEPVVLVHGFTASIETNWAGPGVLDNLARDFRVIALDNRGHGKSGKPHDAKQYGPNMVKDVIRLMDHLEIEKAHIVGYSMGGFMTMYLVTHYPDRVISAVPGGAGWLTPDFTGPNDIADSLESGNGFAPLIEALTPPGQPKPTAEQIETYNAILSATNDVKALAAVARGLTELQVTEEQLKANQVPTLAIIGEIDPLKAGVDAMEGVMANLEVVVVEGADHMNCFARPIFVESIRNFINQHAAAAATTGAGR